MAGWNSETKFIGHSEEQQISKHESETNQVTFSEEKKHTILRKMFFVNRLGGFLLLVLRNGKH